MISLADLSRSLDPFGSQSAAAPASSSGPLPASRPSSESVDVARETAEVTISPEGIRRLQQAAELEAEQAAARAAVGQDAELAAKMAHDIAYRREVVIVPSASYSNYPTSLYSGGTSPSGNAANIAKAQAAADQARLARIALYEFEKAKGTAPAEIYDRLVGLSASQPAGYRISFAS